MSVRRMIGAAAALGLLTTATLIGATTVASAQESDSKWVTLSASGSGDEEIPAGSGEEGTDLTASVQIKETGELNITVVVTGNEEDLTAAHIHKGKEGENGDVVVELDVAAVSDGVAQKLEIEPEVAARIIANPQNYYINTHSASFKPPAGVARGQLTGDAEEPEVINTGTGGQAAQSGPDAGLLAVGGVLVLAAAAAGTTVLRRRSGTDRA